MRPLSSSINPVRVALDQCAFNVTLRARLLLDQTIPELGKTKFREIAPPTFQAGLQGTYTGSHHLRDAAAGCRHTFSALSSVVPTRR